MHSLRTFLRDHRQLAVLLVALALAMKALVPTGYMVGGDAKVLTIEICADASGGKTTKQIVVPHSGKQDEAGKSSTTACPYAGLGMAALPGADAVLLALALAFILLLGFAPTRTAPPRRIQEYLPPLRGPPALA
jgi:hypothetical protein